MLDAVGAGSVAVVCGGSRGMGFATAKRFISEGLRTVVLARDEEKLAEAVRMLAKDADSEVVGIAADATDSAQLARAFGSIGDRFGHVNVLVNAAGPTVVGSFDVLDENEWQRAFSEGTLTAVRSIRAALPLMRQASWARIVNLTAISTQHQSPNLIAYTASKAALASITKNLARTLAADGILVNAVAPGCVLTDTIAAAVSAVGGDVSDPVSAYAVMADRFGSHIDLGRVAHPDEVANVVAFCASEANTFMTGAHINVDGGSDFT